MGVLLCRIQKLQFASGIRKRRRHVISKRIVIRLQIQRNLSACRQAVQKLMLAVLKSKTCLKNRIHYHRSCSQRIYGLYPFCKEKIEILPAGWMVVLQKITKECKERDISLLAQFRQPLQTGW